VLAPENRPRVIAASVLTAISSALSFVVPYLLGETINSFMKDENIFIGEVELTPVALTLMLIAAGTLSQIIPNVRDQTLAPVSANSTRKLMNAITEHQLNKSLDYHGLFSSYPDLKFVFRELAKPSEIVDPYPENALKIKKAPPSIRFERVTFTYPTTKKDEPPLFSDLSFTVKSGETVAFVSKSGGGKSSIFKLLYGYNVPLHGKIFIDEQDISTLSLRSIQTSVGLVAQNPNLFNGTVRENIIYGAKNPAIVTDEEIWALAKAVNLTEFLNSLKDKLDTPVGEDGKQLSGGEQQRVAILRGLLKQTSIRLFDEITSALDSVTANKILDGIQKITNGQTKLIITHKLAESQLADNIFVLADGKVIAEGTHQQLLETCSLYQTLYREQNKHSDIFSSAQMLGRSMNSFLGNEKPSFLDDIKENDIETKSDKTSQAGYSKKSSGRSNI